MIAYFVIFALIGYVIVREVMYYREKLRLYDMIRDVSPGSEEPPSFAKEGLGEEKRRSVGHRRAMMKWRNGGVNLGDDS